MRRVSTKPSSTDPQNEDPASHQQQVRRQGVAYEAAFEAVMAIPIAIGGGYWLDRHFEKSPIFLILGAALGFAAFVIRLLRLGRQLNIPPRAPGRDDDQP
jgi:F0F1-type ATP synthase assembly protein I